MSGKTLRALFAPDWRDGVAYQRLLADALDAQGVTVSFLKDYKRVLPFSRLCRDKRFDLLHLHWPEAYYPNKQDGLDWFRNIRFSLDLALAMRGRALVVTAHNLHAHNRGSELLAQHNYGAAFRRAGIVIAHTDAARVLLTEKFGVNPGRIRVIPHGDLSVTFSPLPAREEARTRLGLNEQPICLMFGAVEPYKGLEEVLEYWTSAQTGIRLAIAGKPITAEYGATIERAAANLRPNVHLHLNRLTDDELALWLSAADCVLFNYRTILTSGAACLTRSLGIPLLLPARATTVDLQEPNARVIRFEALDGSFGAKLHQAITVGRSNAAAKAWRDDTNWEHIAKLTADAYRSAISHSCIRRQ
ncbi:glycosyltransferase [Verrucomicrobiota bacterium sgz303538]